MRRRVGRLAMREEGKWWVAYYALPDTMERALELGRVAMAFIVDQPTRKDEFMRLMKECVGDILEDNYGDRPDWPEGPHPAPEHERSGKA
jgi:hypothetical protein